MTGHVQKTESIRKLVYFDASSNVLKHKNLFAQELVLLLIRRKYWLAFCAEASACRSQRLLHDCTADGFILYTFTFYAMLK